MKNILLFLITFAAFAFGFYMIKRLDNLIIQNRYRLLDNGTGTKNTIRISAETPAFFVLRKSTFRSFSNEHPHIVLRFSIGSAKHLLQKLSRRTLDIALLSEKNTRNLDSDFAYFQISALSDTVNSNNAVSPCWKSCDEPLIYVVWNKSFSSQARDRLLFVLENEQHHSTCGYCDYLD